MDADAFSDVEILDSPPPKLARPLISARAPSRALTSSGRATSTTLKDVDNDGTPGEDPGQEKKVHKNLAFYLRWFTLSKEVGGNRWFSCTGCGEKGQNATFAKPHFKMCRIANPDAINDWNKTFPLDKISAGQSLITRFARNEPAKEKTHPGGFHEALSRLVVRRHLPFSAVDWPEMRGMLDYVFRMGKEAAAKDELKIPHRKQFVSDALLGPQGLIPSLVNEALARHLPYKESCGSNLIFDGVRDVNKAQLLNFLVQSGPVKTVVLVGRVGPHSQTAEFVANVGRGVLSKAINFDELNMGGGGASVLLADNTESQDQTALHKAFSTMLSLSDTICFIGSDNASNVQTAIHELERDLKLVGWGCMAHVYSRVAQKVCSVFDFAPMLHDIVDLFNRTWLREELRRQSGSILVNPSGTRFLKDYLVASKVLKQWDHLCDVTAVSGFNAFISKADDDLKEQGLRVREFLVAGTSKRRILLLKSVLGEFLKTARMFDSSSQYLNCFVYSSFSLLPETIKLVLANPVYADLDLSENFYNDIANAIIGAWDKFHKPVYGAGFMLCHLHIDAVRELKRIDRSEFNSLFEDTVAVIVAMFCRWAPRASIVRDKILDLEDEAVRLFEEQVRSDLEDMVAGCGLWTTFNHATYHNDGCDPRRFWDYKAPTTCFAEYAIRIVCLDPTSSSDAERLHLITKLFRTKQRNSLSYTAVHGLSFAKVEMLQNESGNSAGLEWNELRAIHSRMRIVSDTEEKWAEAQAARWLKEQEEAEAAEEKGEGGAGCEGANGGEGAGNVDLPTEEQEPEVELEQHVMSARGRRRKKKIFADMVRLDDDGGLAY
jgi:hypothetical protein